MPRPKHTSILTGAAWVQEILTGHPDRCRESLGMSATAFGLLHLELVVSGDLFDGKYV
ncbi:hypothetical protein C8F01DRAFT_982378, partial [Mycena amicta]